MKLLYKHKRFMQHATPHSKGFTIIELVLVLAIAGLIFTIVFLALPQLQTSRRDTQRRKDAGRVVAALDTYASNHDGTYPASQDETDSLRAIFLENFKDPKTGSDYSLTYTTTAPDEIGKMSIQSTALCDANGALTTTGATNKQVAVSVRLERGFYCEDNK